MAATREHLDLSDYIKSVHKTLRDNSKTLGNDEAWSKHCKDKETLSKYASAMRELATEHWEQNFSSSSNSRINWVVQFAEGYFKKGGLEAQRIREEDVVKQLNIEHSTMESCSAGSTLKLLDVGSCYNPFSAFKQFSVTAVDIAPATEEVLYCDFLNVNIVEGAQMKDLKSVGDVTELQRNSFNLVVFSLLLEYLPSSDQRLSCCKNAYDLLTPEGILVIITPDSKHVGSNAKLMKSWRYALALLGFSRIKYEKLPHVHCMAFRKCLWKEFALRWTEMHKSDGFSGDLNIPQDFNNSSGKEKAMKRKREHVDEEETLEMLAELPPGVD